MREVVDYGVEHIPTNLPMAYLGALGQACCATCEEQAGGVFLVEFFIDYRGVRCGLQDRFVMLASRDTFPFNV